MKSIGSVAILLGLLGLAWLLVRDVDSATSGNEGKVVVEPLRYAKDAADQVNRRGSELEDRVRNLER